MCEFCPTDGGYCCVCPADRRPPDLFDQGYGGAIARQSLAHVLNGLQMEFGTLGTAELGYVIHGHARGTQEAARLDAAAPEWVPDPEVPGGFVHAKTGDKVPF